MTAKAKQFEQFIRDFNNALTDAKAKWTVSYKSLSDAVQLTAKQAATGQEIYLVWDLNGNSEVYNYPESQYTRSKGDNPGDWTIRNVSEARMIVQGKVRKGSESGRRAGRPRNAGTTDTTDATPTPEQADAKPKATRKRRTADETPANDLPFKMEDDDELILKALSDKVITWKKGVVKMTSHVYPKNLTMHRSKNAATPDRRYIQFADNDGFKTVYLDLIRSVKDAPSSK